MSPTAAESGGCARPGAPPPYVWPIAAVPSASRRAAGAWSGASRRARAPDQIHQARFAAKLGLGPGAWDGTEVSLGGGRCPARRERFAVQRALQPYAPSRQAWPTTVVRID